MGDFSEYYLGNKNQFNFSKELFFWKSKYLFFEDLNLFYNIQNTVHELEMDRLSFFIN